MIIEGYHLEPTESVCPYLEERLFISDNMIINSIDGNGLERLLEDGFRHFGSYFYRPGCSGCRECRSIRIPVNSYEFSGSDRRVLKRADEFSFLYPDKPFPDRKKFKLYNMHKQRFSMEERESYENWESSFFSDQSFNRILEIRDGNTLVAVMHLDVTDRIMSAVYCYWNTEYAVFSPGKLSILWSLKIAKETSIGYYYLGYYIRENKHMSYKINYKPNQLLTDGVWI